MATDWSTSFSRKTEGCSALYRNLGGWRFEDITTAAGVGACDRHSTGAAFADIDGDGDLDLILLATTRAERDLPERRQGHVHRARATSGSTPTGKGGTTVTMADVDGDGDSISTSRTTSRTTSTTASRRSSARSTRWCAQIGARTSYEVVPGAPRRLQARDAARHGRPPHDARAREPDDFYLNDGGRFTRVPMTSDRFRDATGKPLAEEPESFGLGAKFVDLNGDGAPDLYVANDFEDTDQLWFNDGARQLPARRLDRAAADEQLGDGRGRRAT